MTALERVDLDGGIIVAGYQYEAALCQGKALDRSENGRYVGQALEVVINPKTAKALGPTVSPSLLARADEVIE